MAEPGIAAEPAGEEDEGVRPHHRVVGLEVSGGFLDRCRLEFADGLNCIIGGRGTGKTTVIEFIRYVLDQMPSPAENRDRAKAVEGIVRGNLGNGIVSLTVDTRHGTRYRAERPWGDSVQIVDVDGQPVPVSLDRDLVFKADLYSQHEIEAIATTAHLQRSLIDTFDEEAIRAVGQSIAKTRRAIEASAAEGRALDERIQAADDVVPELAVIAQRLEEMQVVAGPDAAVINAAHTHKALRGREAAAIGDLRAVVGTVGDDYAALVGRVVERCRAALGDDGLSAGPNGALFQEVSEAVGVFLRAFEDSVPKTRSRCDRLVARIDTMTRRLEHDHAQQEQQYRALIARSAQDREHAAERARLQARHLELTRMRSERDALRTQRETLQATHAALLARLSDLRDERFALRRAIAERLSAQLGPAVRVSITQAGDRSDYRDHLAEALKGSGLQYMRLVARIVEAVSPEELSVMIRRDQPERLADRAGIQDDQARRVIAHLRAAPAVPVADVVGRLETLDLDDEPLIELKDGPDYKSSADLSTGQRCTVILPIILLESERPLLIDQPEDNLDNAFVFETIVKTIRDRKPSRQMIFVTHNPNIPVLGEAERVFVFTSDGRHGSVSHAGTVDDVKAQIEHLLEGGREAFMLRMHRYGH